jgi:NADH-quinone oxidoreductase subunit J
MTAAVGTLYFYVCAAAAVFGALGVLLSKSPIRGAMGLLVSILSIAGLFLALHAQFLATIQLIVYAGAIVVLFLFVIMLLGPSASTPTDRNGLFTRSVGGGVFALFGLGAIGAVVAAARAAHRSLPMPLPDPSFGGIEPIGSILFSDALVPFELSSALLMVAVIGAIAVAKGRQGTHSLSRSERAVARMAGPEAPADGHDGVFRHETGESTEEHPA